MPERQSIGTTTTVQLASDWHVDSFKGFAVCAAFHARKPATILSNHELYYRMRVDSQQLAPFSLFPHIATPQQDRLGQYMVVLRESGMVGFISCESDGRMPQSEDPRKVVGFVQYTWETRKALPHHLIEMWTPAGQP